MNTNRRRPIKISLSLCSILVSILLLNACGGGSVAALLLSGIGGTGIVYGPLTGFGSVYVNGVKFETNGSQFIVDGNANASQDDLEIGMVVKLQVETENGVYTGKALEVAYDDEVEGPVAASPSLVAGSGGTRKIFNVFGQTITIDETSTIFDATTFADIEQNDIVEISGLRTSPQSINATFVRKSGVLDPGVSEVELRGNISLFSGGSSFELDGVTINFDAMTEIEVPNGILENGLYVEVEGVIQADQSVQADEIEYEEEGFADAVDDVSLQGVISNYVSIADFEINGQAVNAAAAELSPGNIASLLADGVTVEVEGDILAGVLIAEELELRDGESKVKSFVSAIDTANNRFEVNFPPLPGRVVISADGQTIFEDEGPLQMPNFSVNLMNIGDYVEVEGIADGAGINATIVKRKLPDNIKLEGSVESFVVTNSITILGIDYPVDPAAEYQNNSLSAAAFFALLQIGDIVELEDDEPDGDADEIEFEN